MRVVLHSIEIENFKTYKGKTKIGPLKPFSAIIGPNGSGKSNLLDAVLFAMGEKVSNLRVTKPSDLAYGAHVGTPVSQPASVSLHFRFEDGSLIRCQRTVVKTVQHYFLDGKRVSCAEYLSELEKIGINVKARNFQVYQGMVEDVGLMVPKERTSLFEEISGSKSLKSQYDEANAELAEIENVTQLTYLKQRSVRNLRKEAMMEKEESLKYEQLQKESDQKYIELQLFKLFYNQKKYENLMREFLKNEEQLNELKVEKLEAEKQLKLAVRALERKTEKVSQEETAVQTKEAQIKELQISLAKVKQEAIHKNKKLDNAISSLEKAQELHKKHLQNMDVLQTELSATERECSKFEETVTQESLSQGIDIVLEESQNRDYNKLKKEAAKLTASCQQGFESLLRKQKRDEDRRDTKEQECTDNRATYEKKCKEKNDKLERCRKLSDHIRSNDKQLEEWQRKYQSLLSIHETCNEKIASLREEVDDLDIQLSDAHFERHDLDRKKKALEVVQRLKQFFPGVIGRLTDLCSPIHPKYHIALTKVMGSNMDAIVVDQEKTARLCIDFLKKQMLKPERFLPLDYLNCKPLEEHLKNKLPNKCYLLYDVLTLNSPNIKGAVLYAIGSAVVCETDEIAMTVAYELLPHKHLNAISLVGTYYQKSGLISGGSVELAKRAKHWDEKMTVQMQARRDELVNQLRGYQDKARIQSELNVIKCEIDGLKTRSKLMKYDLEKSKDSIDAIEQELGRLNDTFQDHKAQLSSIKQGIQKRGDKLKELECQIWLIEDQVFAEFCHRIGVPNIRTYEVAGLRKYEDREKERMKFEDRKNCILNQLEYEKTVDTKSNIIRWTSEVELLRSAIEAAKLNEKDILKSIQNASKNLLDVKKDFTSFKQEVLELEKEVDVIQTKVKTVKEALQTKKLQNIDLEVSISKLIRLRRFILIHCKSEGIELPILEGSLDMLGRTDASSESSTPSTEDSLATNSEIVINFNHLADNLKSLEKDAQINEYEASMKENIGKLVRQLQIISAPNLKVEEKLREVTCNLKETKVEFEYVRKKSRQAKERFEKIKRERCNLFYDCLDFVSNEIDVIYKQMNGSPSALALLTAENQEEPYLGGVSYCCIAPGKPCKPMHSLSGGEKTVASIALLIALHQYRSAPCLLLDEIDAALDQRNIANIASFFSRNKEKFQILAISLSSHFYCHADSLIGVTLDDAEDGNSAVFEFDLSVFPM